MGRKERVERRRRNRRKKKKGEGGGNGIRELGEGEGGRRGK